VSRRRHSPVPDQVDHPAQPGAPSRQPRTLPGLVRYFLRLGSSGFGGPIALVGYMQRDLVESRGWFTKEFERPQHGGKS